MKILIVNGYSSNYNGYKRFDDFLAIVKDVPCKYWHALDILEATPVDGVAAGDRSPR